METKISDDSETISKSNIVTANVVILVVFLLIVGGIFLVVSKKSKGQQVFPAGINYLAPTTAAAKPVMLYDFTKLAASTDWVTYTGKLFPYSFQYPKEFTPVTYPGDKSDSVAFKVSSVPPEQSLLLTVEKISGRDKNLVGKPEEFVRNYWKFFSGLKALKTITTITNEKGLTGYKATYVIKGSNAVTSDYYFFTVPDDNDTLLHIGDIFPTEDKTMINRIVNSLEYKK
jgi:hypothetical protein